METSTVLTIVTSSIALVVAIISGLFSYFSSKRAAKVEAMQYYLQFLQHKMNKLEEIIKVIDLNGEKHKDEDLENLFYKSVRDFYTDCDRIIVSNGHLFTEERKEIYKKLHEKRGQINFENTLTGYKIKEKDISADEIVNLLDNTKNRVSEMIQFCSDVRDLVNKELEATYNKFEQLSLK